MWIFYSFTAHECWVRSPVNGTDVHSSVLLLCHCPMLSTMRILHVGLLSVDIGNKWLESCMMLFIFISVPRMRDGRTIMGKKHQLRQMFTCQLRSLGTQETIAHNLQCRQEEATNRLPDPRVEETLRGLHTWRSSGKLPLSCKWVCMKAKNFCHLHSPQSQLPLTFLSVPVPPSFYRCG